MRGFVHGSGWYRHAACRLWSDGESGEAIGARFTTRYAGGGESEMTESQRRRVAIVDDDADSRDSLRYLLEVMGCAVETFVSAAEFLQADERRFACLILDQHMPQMTGLGLAETLRADGSDIPILLITGSGSPSIVARATELGIAGVLEKPFQGDDLIDFVDCHRP